LEKLRVPDWEKVNGPVGNWAYKKNETKCIQLGYNRLKEEKWQIINHPLRGFVPVKLKRPGISTRLKQQEIR